MTQRSQLQNQQTPSYSEEIPMDDILVSIRNMVSEEQAALVNLKQISEQVNSMVDSLSGNLKAHDDAVVSSPSSNIDQEDHSFAEEHPSLDHYLKSGDVSSEVEVMQASKSTHSLEQTIESSSVNAPLTDSEQLVQNALVDCANDDDSFAEDNPLPLPGLDGLADLVEDFLNEETNDPNWKKYYDPDHQDHPSDEFAEEDDYRTPSAFLQEQAAIATGQRQVMEEIETAHYGYAPNGTFRSRHEVFDLTTIVHPDGSTTSLKKDLHQNIAQGLTQGLIPQTNDDNVLAQAFEIAVARVIEPMVEEWLNQNGPALIARFVKNIP